MTYSPDTVYCWARDCRHFNYCPVAMTYEVKAAATEAAQLPIKRFTSPKALYCYKPYESTTDSDHQASD